jgi:phage-related tail fiber protein
MSQARTMTEVQPPGMVSFFGNSSAPDGWLPCNGAAVSRTTYSDLFSIIGTTYGSGNGSSTFNVPDLRGEFIRGWDGGRGLDSNFGANPRGFATVQKGSAAAYNLPFDEGYGGYIKAGNDDNPEAGRVVVGVDAVSGDDYQGTVSGHVPGSGQPINDGNWITDGGWGGGAARPRNVALLLCIKY